MACLVSRSAATAVRIRWASTDANCAEISIPNKPANVTGYSGARTGSHYLVATLILYPINWISDRRGSNSGSKELRPSITAATI